MVNLHPSTNNNKNNKQNRKERLFNNNGFNLNQYRRLVSIGKISVDIINELCNPIDATNRFINLALQNIEEDSQSRQFLLESKSGIRKMSILVKRLNRYAKKIEKEVREILTANE